MGCNSLLITSIPLRLRLDHRVKEKSLEKHSASPQDSLLTTVLHCWSPHNPWVRENFHSKLEVILHQPREFWGGGCSSHATRAQCAVSQGQRFSHSPVFMSPQTQSCRNMWFWSAHVQGRGQLKHQRTIIVRAPQQREPHGRSKPKCPGPGPWFQSCLVLWEPCSQAHKQWLLYSFSFSPEHTADAALCASMRWRVNA